MGIALLDFDFLVVRMYQSRTLDLFTTMRTINFFILRINPEELI